MNRELCHTCQYEHNWIACSGCEHDNDEYVCAEWFTKKEAEIRADEKRKCEKEFKRVLENHWLNGTVAHRIIDEILAEYEKDQKDGVEMTPSVEKMIKATRAINHDISDLSEACKIAISALERQMPKEPSGQ